MPKKGQRLLMHRYATVVEADKDFYQAYDALFLARKADFLYKMYKNSAAILDESQKSDAPIASTDDELRTLLATELHCTVFHQTEALIALILAEYQDKPDWVYLTTYGSAEIKAAASAIATNQKKIPGTTASSMTDLVKTAVYATFDLSAHKEIADQWKESISSIVALLQIVSQQLIDAHEYNSYKHGLRVVLGSANFGVAHGEQHNFRTLASMRHAMTFLQIEKLGEDSGAQMVTKEIKPEYSCEVVTCMGNLLSVIKTFRLARINGAFPCDVTFPIFDALLLARIKPATNVAFSY